MTDVREERKLTKFHIAMLVIKREPRDVYLACALKDSRGYVQTTAVMFNHDIRLKSSIEPLIRAIWIVQWYHRRHLMKKFLTFFVLSFISSFFWLFSISMYVLNDAFINIYNAYLTAWLLLLFLLLLWTLNIITPIYHNKFFKLFYFA